MASAPAASMITAVPAEAADAAPPYWVRNRYVRLTNDTLEVVDVVINRA